MTQVTSDATTSVSSSNARKQTEKPENQKDVLFENLFSTVSDIDREKVNFLNSDLSHHDKMTMDFNSDKEKETSLNHTDNNIFEIFAKDDENNGNSSLTTAMQRLEALLNEKETLEDNQKIGEENKDLFAISEDPTNDITNSVVTPKGRRVPLVQAFKLFSDQIFDYSSSNLNSLSSNDTKNTLNDLPLSKELSKVVKLIENAVNSKNLEHSLPKQSIEIKTNSPASSSDGSALDKAIEALSELKSLKNSNAESESIPTLKKDNLLSRFKGGEEQKNVLANEEFKNVETKNSPLINLKNKENSNDIRMAALTRQVELSQQATNNSINQANFQMSGLDINSGSSNGQEGNENQQGSTFTRNSSPLSSIQKLNMADKAWKEILTQKIETQLKEGIKTLDISLNPKHLGRMTVSINMSGDDASIQISTETSAAANVLLESEAKLAQMMQDIGLRLNLLQASFSSKQDKETKQDVNSKNSGKKLEDSKEDMNGLDKANFKNIDNSILNIVA